MSLLTHHLMEARRADLLRQAAAARRRAAARRPGRWILRRERRLRGRDPWREGGRYDETPLAHCYRAAGRAPRSARVPARGSAPPEPARGGTP